MQYSCNIGDYLKISYGEFDPCNVITWSTEAICKLTLATLYSLSFSSLSPCLSPGLSVASVIQGLNKCLYRPRINGAFDRALWQGSVNNIPVVCDLWSVLRETFFLFRFFKIFFLLWLRWARRNLIFRARGGGKHFKRRLESYRCSRIDKLKKERKKKRRSWHSQTTRNERKTIAGFRDSFQMMKSDSTRGKVPKEATPLASPSSPRRDVPSPKSKRTSKKLKLDPFSGDPSSLGRLGLLSASISLINHLERVVITSRVINKWGFWGWRQSSERKHRRDIPGVAVLCLAGWALLRSQGPGDTSRWHNAYAY